MIFMGIVEIAKLAGVSHATVSRAMNRPDVVSSKTLEKINRVIEQTGYKPLPVSVRPGRKQAKTSNFRTGNVAFVENGDTRIGFTA